MNRTLAALLLAWPAYAGEIRVIDGDTFVMAGETVRIANIDAAEKRCRCPAECMLAEAATEALRRLLGDGTGVRVVRTGVDRYGRSLALVEASGEDVGEAMVKARLVRRWSGRREPWC